MELDKKNPFPLSTEEQEDLADQVIAGQDDLWGNVIAAYNNALIKNNNPAFVEALRSSLENSFGDYLPKVINFFEYPSPFSKLAK